jgi:alpha-beta hydrolase superfamily lysophospholipase
VGAALLVVSACVPVDSLFFRPRRPVDGYDFDGADPDLDGHLSEPHPSIVGPEDRREGFVETEHGAVHWVLARRRGATGVILYSHGNAVHLGRYWDRVERLWRLGFHVLVYDYPGYGLSSGEPSEEAVIASARAMREHLETLPETANARVFLYGYSLGGVPTFDLAARGDRGEGPPNAGVIAESTFCSIEDLLQDNAQVGLPATFATHLVMDNCAAAARLEKTPVLLIHGTEDQTVLAQHAALLEQAASGVRVDVHRVEGAGHRDVPRVAGAHYDDWVRAFAAR